MYKISNRRDIMAR